MVANTIPATHFGEVVRNNYGFIDENGKETVPLKYTAAFDQPASGLFCIGTDFKYGFTDQNGKEVIPLHFDYAEDFHGNLALAKEKDKWGFIGTNGKFVIPAIFEKVNSFADDYAMVLQNDKWGIIDKKGKFLVPCIYDYLYLPENGYIRVNKPTGSALLDLHGKEVLTSQYEFTEKYSEGLITFVSNNKYGFLDISGKVIIEAKYKKAGFFKNGIALVSNSNGKEYYIDSKGNEFYSEAAPGQIKSTKKDLSEFMATGTSFFYTVDKSYDFIVQLTELSDKLIFDYEMKKTEFRPSLFGTIVMDKTSLESATQQYNSFSGGYTELENTTSVWLSKSVYQSLKNRKEVSIASGYADEILTFVRNETMVLSVNDSFVEINVLYGETDNGHKYWILDNPDYPLIVKMSIGFDVELYDISAK